MQQNKNASAGPVFLSLLTQRESSSHTKWHLELLATVGVVPSATWAATFVLNWAGWFEYTRLAAETFPHQLQRLLPSSNSLPRLPSFPSPSPTSPLP